MRKKYISPPLVTCHCTPFCVSTTTKRYSSADAFFLFFFSSIFPTAFWRVFFFCTIFQERKKKKWTLTSFDIWRRCWRAPTNTCQVKLETQKNINWKPTRRNNSTGAAYEQKLNAKFQERKQSSICSNRSIEKSRNSLLAVYLQFNVNVDAGAWRKTDAILHHDSGKARCVLWTSHAESSALQTKKSTAKCHNAQKT